MVEGKTARVVGMTPGHLKAEAENPFTFRDERLFALWSLSFPPHILLPRSTPAVSPAPLPTITLDENEHTRPYLTALDKC